MRPICPITVCKCWAAGNYVNPNESDNPVQNLTPELIKSYYRDEFWKLVQDLAKAGVETRVLDWTGEIMLDGKLQCSWVCIRARNRVKEVLQQGFSEWKLIWLQNVIPKPGEVAHEEEY
jgi:hypothetical protein